MRCYELCLLAPHINSQEAMEIAFNESLQIHSDTLSLGKTYFCEVIDHLVYSSKGKPYNGVPPHRKLYVAHLCADGTDYKSLESLKRLLHSFKPYCKKLSRREANARKNSNI